MSFAKGMWFTCIDHQRSAFYLTVEGLGIKRTRSKWSFNVCIIIAVPFDDIIHVGRALWQILVHIVNKFDARARNGRRIMLTLKADGRAGLGAHATSAQ